MVNCAVVAIRAEKNLLGGAEIKIFGKLRRYFLRFEDAVAALRIPLFTALKEFWAEFGDQRLYVKNACSPAFGRFARQPVIESIVGRGRQDDVGTATGAGKQARVAKAQGFPRRSITFQ